ncbi:MAG: 2-oxo acid dehydrogenase subunit E2, partial [Chloroflexi bacterium]|nr:2-oxo acid dehydrogenase subunit E2 [Chloroflexota bacterium]
PAAAPAAASAPTPTPAPAPDAGSPDGAPSEPGRASPAVKRLAASHGLDLGAIVGSGVGGRILRSDVEQAAAAAAAPPAPAGPVKASPAAKRLAREHDLDLASVNGTGPGGRIVTEDVEAALAAAPAAAEAPAATAAEGETLPYRGMRRTIGGRMHASLQEMAQLTMAMDADMTRAVDLRRELLDLWSDRELRPTYTDFVMKAAALALRAHPRLNAELRDDEIVLHPRIHVGFAVALDEGLIVPVTRDTDALPLDELAPISADLAARARERRLGPDDLTGGTFTVTTLGMYGIDVFTPIINPPQAAILGVGRISDRPVLRGESGTDVERRSFMTLSLTIDHRVVDGAPAAEFLRDVKGILERPSQLILP